MNIQKLIDVAEKTIARLKKVTSDDNRLFNTIIEDLTEALSQFHSTGKEKGLKWVKASERLPENGVRVIVREKSGQTNAYNYWQDQEESWKKYIDEWLDESIEGEDRDKELAELKGIHDGEINLKDAAIVELSEEIEKLRGARFQDIKQIERLKGILRKEYDKGLLALQFRSDTLDKMWEQFSKNNDL